MQVDKRRKQIHTQNTMKLPAVPGPLSGPLTELWERANDLAVAARVAAVAADRREAVAAKEAKAARKRAAKQAAAADVPEETAHEAELEEVQCGLAVPLAPACLGVIANIDADDDRTVFVTSNAHARTAFAAPRQIGCCAAPIALCISLIVSQFSCSRMDGF